MDIIIGMFIGAIIGFFTVSLISGQSYDKGRTDGYREAQQNESLH